MLIFVALAAIKEHLGSVDSTRLPVNDSHDLMLALAWIVEASMGGSSGAVSVY